MNHDNQKIVYTSSIDTPLGQMIIIVDEHHLYLLDFIDHKKLAEKTALVKQKINATIIPGRTAIIDLIEQELAQYFQGMLQKFTTPLYFLGSAFQQSVWLQLQKIPHGQTISYAQLAIAIGNPAACRAVAQANGANHLAIIIPCHRVINADGKLGGYGGGINRKTWLLNHERNQGTV